MIKKEVLKYSISTDCSDGFYLDIWSFFDTNLLRSCCLCKLIEMKNYYRDFLFLADRRKKSNKKGPLEKGPVSVDTLSV